MKIKTQELTGAALDWAVARCTGIPANELRTPDWSGSLYQYLKDEDGNLNGRYMTGPDLLFSRKWEAGGPIIERERIELRYDRTGRWANAWLASTLKRMLGGPTPLIAAMRCFVASELGDEVDIPEELLK